MDRIQVASGGPGIERFEARFHGRPFAPHRHDTYAIGLTLSGVQRFRFRGSTWHCLPGQCHVLHPDELHDGEAGTDQAFVYRIVHLDPVLVQQALGGHSLPFVAAPVLDCNGLAGTGLADLLDFDHDLDAVAQADLVVAAADLLLQAAAGPQQTAGRLHLPALLRVRELVSASPAQRQPLAALEQVAGLDRWALARQFRAAFGTSPSRFRTLRQLDMVRLHLRAGATPAAAADAAGFADQSHMSRQFKRAFGLTPARWAALLS